MANAIKFKYELSEKFCNKIFIETGEMPSKNVELSIEATALSPEARSALIQTENGWQQYCVLSEKFDSYLSINDINASLVKRLEDRNQKIKEALDAAIEKIKEYEQKSEEDLTKAYDLKTQISDEKFKDLSLEWYEKLEAIRQLQKRVKQSYLERERELERRKIEHQEAAKQRRLEQKKGWIESNGSKHLKKAFGAGYDCQRLYAQERAAMEFPAFHLDFDNKAEWNSRSCPSMKALEIAEEYSREIPEIVWVTRKHDFNPEEDLYYPENNECEAVVIRDFLGKYDLVHYV